MNLVRAYGRGRRWAAALIAGWAVLAAWPGAAATLTQIKAVVVRVVVFNPSDPEMVTGSGFKVASGLYVTNRHVIEKASDPGYQVVIVPETGGPVIPAVVKTSVDADLALLSADDIPGAPLTFDPNLPDSGQSVIALGFPGQMDEVLDRRQLSAATQPDVSIGAAINTGQTSDGEDDSVTKIVHSANIWPGNSGGPLIDTCGRLLGVNTWVHAENGLAQQNISISSKDVLQFLTDNQVQPTVDTQPCTAQTIAAGPAAPAAPAGPTPPPAQTAAPQGGGDGGGLAGIIAIAVLALAAVVGGAVAVARRQETERRAAAEIDSQSDW